MTKLQPRYDAIDPNADLAFDLAVVSATLRGHRLGTDRRHRQGSARPRPAAFDRLLHPRSRFGLPDFPWWSSSNDRAPVCDTREGRDSVYP